jgi:hypothetical protein
MLAIRCFNRAVGWLRRWPLAKQHARRTVGYIMVAYHAVQ